MSEMLGALMAILISMMAVLPYVAYEHQGIVNQQIAATAGQERVIAEAAQNYIQQNYTAVEAASTATTPAVITVPMLQATNMLPASITGTNPYGQTWTVQVLQPSAGNLQALVLSSGGQSIPQGVAPAIAAQTGQAGGFIPYAGQYGSLAATIAEGAYNGWSVSMTGYTNPGAGHLAALVAFSNGNLQNDYLYRVAVPGHPELNTMETNLNMGTNNISNADTITAGPGDGTCNTDASGHCIGQISAGGLTEASLPGGWGGGVVSRDLYSVDGTIGVGAAGVGPQAQLQDRAGGTAASGGTLWLGNASGQQTAIGYADNSASAFSVQNASGAYANMYTTPGGVGNSAITTNGNMQVINPTNNTDSFYALNNGYGAVSDTFSVGSRLELGTAFGGANLGWGCSPNGEVAANANGTGQLMDCVNGIWENTIYPIGTSVTAYSLTRTNSDLGWHLYCSLNVVQLGQSGGTNDNHFAWVTTNFLTNSVGKKNWTGFIYSQNGANDSAEAFCFG
jgi:hypothetical protein